MPGMGDERLNPPWFPTKEETPHEIRSLIDGRDDRGKGNYFDYGSDPLFRGGVDVNPILDYEVVPFKEIPVEGRNRKHEQKFPTAVENKRRSLQSEVDGIQDQDVSVPEEREYVLRPGEDGKEAQSLSQKNQ